MHIPLSERLRPKILSDIAGQDHLVGTDGYIARIVQNGRPLSLLLFGPPGCGKTTIARLYAQAFSLPFVTLSAVFNGTADLKKILKDGQETPLFNRQTILFVDEIHRFNRAQQDIFLPFLEDGSLILIGATTENPSFSLNNALLSRLRVLTLNTLSPESLEKILHRYEAEKGSLNISEDGKRFLISLCQGDGRHLLNLIENLEQSPRPAWDIDSLSQILQKKPPLYDKHEEGHYNLISALHKSVRGSDPDAALYWFVRMLEGGEDPRFLGRRLIRMASEDIGLADPQALGMALDGWNTYHMLGSPEGELALAQVVIYLALAPKSNAAYVAYGHARKLAAETGHLNPPKHILNAPTPLMEEMGYGAEYQYDPDTPHGFSGQEYFPDELSRPVFYEPVERGFEREMKKRLEYFKKLRSYLHQSNG
ncbi:MAG TPA: replication-associated recombination protein A [Chlamydiales bacterium]|nr:replication-associated recombination protein A [Chlamydiales bacterium]